jgi:hypothetical protein
MAILHNFSYNLSNPTGLWNQLLPEEEALSPLPPPSSSTARVHNFVYDLASTRKNFKKNKRDGGYCVGGSGDQEESDLRNIEESLRYKKSG